MVAHAIASTWSSMAAAVLAVLAITSFISNHQYCCLHVNAQSATATQSCLDSAGGANGGICGNGGEESGKVTFDAFGAWVDGAKRNAEKFLSEKIFVESTSASSAGGQEADAKSGEGDVMVKLQSLFDSAAAGFADLFADHKDGSSDAPAEATTSTTEYDDIPLVLSGHGVVSGMMKLISSVATGADNEESTMQLVERAKEISDGQSAYETRTFKQTFNIFSSAFDLVKESMDSHFGDIIQLSSFNPFSYLYYLELEDERKNPSWKRRAHRFYKSVKPEEIIELHASFYLAELSYVDTVDEIRAGLEDSDWELVYAKIDASPTEPGHYLAIKRTQKKKPKEPLEVLLSVRGTKEIGDLLSDAFLDAEDYRGGKAHVGVKMSGRFLVDKHTYILEQMLELSGKEKIKLNLVGHSLGAGAASIAAIEFNDNPLIDSNAIGFGCPALLSKDIAEKDYILTVVSDADVVPRMSGATVRNAILDVMAYDWADAAYRDVEQLMTVVKDHFRALSITDEFEKRVLSFVKKSLDDTIKPFVKTMREQYGERLEPLLVPPGSCIHVYRDGSGFSARHTPCSYFDAIEISRTMVDDHMTPQGYHRAMLNFMRDATNDNHFRFAHDTLF